MPLTKREERVVGALLDTLLDWPCETFDQQPGGRHYRVDYTVAKARRCYQVFALAARTFPQLVDAATLAQLDKEGA